MNRGKKMKILQINSVCGRGSTGRIVSDIPLLENGHESYVAYGRGSSVGCLEAIRIGTDFDVYMHVLKTRLFDLHGFGSKKATARFLRRVEEIDPDIIHLHNIHGYYINIELLFKYLKEKQKPVVWTLHDCWAFTGHCTYFDFVGCDRWKTGCYHCPQKRRYPASWILDRSRKNWQDKKRLFTGIRNTILVTPSKWLADLVKQSFLKEYPVEVIPNGIDTEVFKPTQGDFRKKYNIEGKFIILGVANKWEERKGLKYFFELANMLRDDEVIVLVGLTKKQIKELPKGIIGIQRTNSVKELAEIYTAADVFVNPTFEDNYPTVNLEAQACGTYVITFASGGAPETIVRTGTVINDKTSEKIREAIDNVRRSGYPKNKTMIRDVKDMIDDYIELYNLMAKNRRTFSN